MLGIIILVTLLVMEVGFSSFCLVTKSDQVEKRKRLSIAQFVLFLIVMIVGIVDWSFRWNMLFVVLLIRALLSIWYYLRKSHQSVKTYKKKGVIIRGVRVIFLLTFAIAPAIMFPQFKPIEPTGNYDVKTISYTLTDTNKIEKYSAEGKNRNVTVQFWYPDSTADKYPLLIFSHGSFGFRGSNASTFENLASNGYVVCSIDHTYQAFFTSQTDGEMVIADMKFINDATAVQNGDVDEKTTYSMTHEWLDLRLSDVSFVLDDIVEKTSKASADEVYQHIDKESIGLFGHSLGGATAAELGRERTDIDAVIVVDGTMLGEEVNYADGKALLNNTPYPVPLLNIYNEDHYEQALAEINNYPNMVATKNAKDARQVVIQGSGHLNFTDLPMFSPILAGMLGTGTVDRRYCIETMNEIILDYFNYYLKDSKELQLLDKY
jgi:dienelactone hydrolase